MFKWVINRLIDILLVFLIVSALLWYAAVNYPQFFPIQFFSYWHLPAPMTAAQTPTSQVQP